jgi:hypothetical protein
MLAGSTLIEVELANDTAQPALAVKLTALDAQGGRVLPVFYGDNYVTLLPGARRQVRIECPRAAARCERLGLRGWNVAAREVTLN